MARFKTYIIFAVGVGCLVVLVLVVMEQRRDHSSMLNGTDSVLLEREIRTELPPGSSVATVEGFLTKRGIEFSFDASSKSIYAVARKLKGSTPYVSKSLQFQFRFDDVSSLKGIDAKVLYTGP